jgi:hypothetical protein
MKRSYFTLIPISFLFVVLSLFLQACGATSSITIDKEYKGKHFEDVSITVSLPRNELVITNGDDVTDDLGDGDVYDVYRNFFNEQFAISLKKYSTFKNVVPLELKKGIYNDTNFTTQSYTIGKNGLLIFHVPKGVPIYAENDSTRFILFIEGFKIYREQGTTGMFIPGAFGTAPSYTGGSNPKLGHQFRFIVWDNEFKKVVYYGEVTSEDDVGYFSMTKTDWKTNLDAIAKELVDKSPFRKSK